MVKETENFDNYNSEVLDIDEMGGTDIKINPDYYIHNALLKAQSCLIKEDSKTGFLQFRLMIEHIQVLAESAGILDIEEFEKDLDTFKDTEEYKNEDDKILKSTMLANNKLKLIMDNVFSSKPIRDTLKL